MAVAPPPPPPPPPQPVPAPSFQLTRAKVAPRHPLFAAGPVRLRFRFSAAGPLDLRVQIRRRGGRVVRRFDLRAGAPPGPVRVRWNGLTARGHPAPDGRYRVSVGPREGRLSWAGGFLLRGHVYPIRGPHSFRGPIGTFGVPRSGGRSHEGFDINARCGTAVVAARGGRVRRRGYDPVLYGNYVIVRGSHERRDYWYTHLRAPARVRTDGRVRTGQRLGEVGASGNARTVGCHLHLELHGPGGPFDPLPRLRAWDRFS